MFSVFAATVWYIGPGQLGTGNWCFRDNGFVSFRDVFAIYKENFAGKALSLVLDCPYAGCWPLAFVELFDDLGIPACGHKLREQGIMIKFFASCGERQVPSELLFSLRAIAPDDNHIWYKMSKISDFQQPKSINFTKITCLSKPYDSCKVSSRMKWKDMMEKDRSKRLVLVHGKDKGQAAWHYVLLRDANETLKEFNEKIATGTINVARYGEILASGWGEDPPPEIKGSLPCL